MLLSDDRPFARLVRILNRRYDVNLHVTVVVAANAGFIPTSYSLEPGNTHPPLPVVVLLDTHHYEAVRIPGEERLRHRSAQPGVSSRRVDESPSSTWPAETVRLSGAGVDDSRDGVVEGQRGADRHDAGRVDGSWLT